ncbi:alpha/beta fold hydrolase [Candidatus Uabimicrobium amorphum]|uniref:Alpha/beta hydrolase fold protein n=1 Tax=Uabimicrobium amorphum TaxID=2596890 RepID=A0A5S9F5T4_UABAM|nr:alpha/beta hydrolase [Candidatus Uabimicrobium amorphum]BBM87186.1 alpha/beta hydrolase fold protein [Candidatus Uabimicrobium amorphum]
MPHAMNKDVKLYYEVHGSGQPLFLIMGLGGTSESWRFQVQYFCKYYQVIVMDNRGAGRSDKPDEEYTTQIFASDVKQVLDELNIDQAHIFGLSMGGMIAQQFCLSYPQYVKSLLISCSGTGAPDPYYVPCSEKVANILRMDRTEENRREVTEKIIEVFYHHTYRTQIPDLLERILSLPITQPDYAYKRQLQACRLKEHTSPRLKNIDVPTLVIHGEDDEVWPVQNAHNLAELIPKAQCAVLPECGHMFFIEKPREYNREIHDFLKSIV